MWKYQVERLVNKNLIHRYLNVTLRKVFFILILLFTYFSYAQMDTKVLKMKYESSIKIKLGEKIVLEDGLSIVLKFFSHKNSVDGTITKASAYIVLTMNNDETEQILSTYSYEDTKTDEDGLAYKTTTSKYDQSIFWKTDEIQLKAFEYDEFIKVFVTKKSP